MEPTIETSFDDDPPGWTGTLSEFLHANSDNEDACVRTAELELGEETLFGGGAAPLARVRRIS